jgi:uncharacterized repeat protein (TIGR01451 family)
MKTLFLILSVLISTACFAQQTQLENFCGHTIFNLTESIPNLTQNPSQANVTFHFTQNDAANNLNAIINATNFTTISLNETVYARIENLINNAISFSTIYLVVNTSLLTEITFSQDIPPSTANALALGGQIPYTYEWSINGNIIPNQTTNSLYFLNLPTGLLSVIITDANGCSGFTSENIFTPLTINANNDFGNIITPLTSGIGYTNILANDTLNGIQVLASDVILTLVSSTNSGITLSGTNVMIAQGTAPGIHSLTYQICEIANPNNCDTAIVNFILTSTFLNAEDDFLDIYDPITQVVTFSDILLNDTLNGSPLMPSQVAVTFVSSTNQAITMSGTNVIVAANIQSGLYSLTYQICELNNPDNCSFASVIILVNGILSIANNIDLMNFTAKPKPGIVYKNYISFSNNTNETIPSGTITFTKDNLLSISAIEGAIATANANGFIYNFTNLLPNEDFYITVSLQVPNVPISNVGDLVTNTASISYSDGTNTVTENSSLTETIINTLDPNSISERFGGRILHSAFDANDYLTYTIRFENSGATIINNLQINDFLDNKLDETSIRTVRTSHPFVLDRVANNLNWRLNGINFPPNTPNDEITGQGYIVFQVKPKPGYAVGDIIPNKSSIYFDSNPVIETEIYNTEFVGSLSNENFEFNNLLIYPNPVSNILNIENNEIIENLEVSNVLGQKVLFKKVDNSKTKIDLSGFTNGIYFVKILNNKEKTLKIIKE